MTSPSHHLVFQLKYYFLEKPSLIYYILCYPLPQLFSYSSNPESYFIFLIEYCCCCCCCSLVATSCLTFCNPMGYSLPNSSVHGISQARILVWVAISFSTGSSWLRDGTHVSCIGRQILYCWASMEAPLGKVTYYKKIQLPLLLNLYSQRVSWFVTSPPQLYLSRMESQFKILNSKSLKISIVINI